MSRRTPLVFAALAVFVGCVEPAPHALITLLDPDGLATDATTIAVANEAGVFRRIEIQNASSLSFTVVSPRAENEELLTFEALSGAGLPLARTRARVFFPDGQTESYELKLRGVCETDGSAGRGCRLDDGSGDGVCVAGRCRETGCGDGIVDPDAESGPEECDDGNLLSDDDCTPLCRFNVCGDGFVNSFLEECDDGSESGNEDNCVIACTDIECVCRLNVCGDGFVNRTELAPGIPAEECDDANLTETDGCLSTCRLNVCGDGVVHQGVEQCDDANDNPNDGCDACTVTTWTSDLLFGLASPAVFDGPTPTGGRRGRLTNPVDIAWAPPDGLVIVERGGAQLYRIDFASGRLTALSTRGSTTSGDRGPVAFATFQSIGRVAVGLDGTIALSDRAAHRVRQIDAGTGAIDTAYGIGVAGAPGGPFGENVMDTPIGVSLTPEGGLLFVDSGNNRVRAVPPLSSPFGSTAISGGDGLAIGANGLVYVADSGAGVVRVSDGATVSDFFTSPSDLAAHPDGRILVVDSNRLFSIDPSAGNAVAPVAGTGGNGFSPDGTAATIATFSDLVAVAADARAGQDRIYLAERGAGLIRVIVEGTLQTAWGDVSEERLPELSAEALVFASLGSIDSDGNGGFFVTDPGDGLVYRINAAGDVAVFAGRAPSLVPPTGNGDGGLATDATLQCPVRVSLAVDGSAYVPDRCSDEIRVVAPDGTISTAATGALSNLEDAVVDASGRLLVADDAGLRLFDGGPSNLTLPLNDRIEQLTLVGSTLYFLDVSEDTGGNAVSATLRTASGAAFDSLATLTSAAGLTAYAVSASGTVHYVTAGGELYRYVDGSPDVLLNPSPSGRGDGGPVAEAGFGELAPLPRGTTSMRALGNAVYIADHGFGVFRRIVNETIDSAIGRVQSTDGRFPYASLADPTAVASLSDGSWLVADGPRVLLVSDGRVMTILGYPDGTPLHDSAQPARYSAYLGAATGIAVVSDTLAYVVDGPRGHLIELARPDASAEWSARVASSGLDEPSALAYGASPNGTPSLFVSEEGPHTVSRLALDTFNTTLLAGGGAGFADAEAGVAARFDQPRALAVGDDGTIFVADRGNNRVRAIRCNESDACAVSTILGASLPGRLAAEDFAREARTELPATLAFDDFGNLLVGSDQELALLLPETNGRIGSSSRVVPVSQSSDQLRVGCFAGAAWTDAYGSFLVLDRCTRAAIQVAADE